MENKGHDSTNVELSDLSGKSISLVLQSNLSKYLAKSQHSNLRELSYWTKKNWAYFNVNTFCNKIRVINILNVDKKYTPYHNV